MEKPDFSKGKGINSNEIIHTKSQNKKKFAINWRKNCELKYFIAPENENILKQNSSEPFIQKRLYENDTDSASNTLNLKKHDHPTTKIIKEMGESLKKFEVQMNRVDSYLKNSQAMAVNQKTEKSLSRIEWDNNRTTTDNITGQKFQIQHREKLTRLFTGSVENLYVWSKLKNDLDILFEVIGIVNDIQIGASFCEKIILLSDSKTGPAIQVFYYEIDRPLQNIPIKSTVICIGRLVTRNRFQAFKIQQSSMEEKACCQRLAYLCNRVGNEVISLNQSRPKYRKPLA